LKANATAKEILKNEKEKAIMALMKKWIGGDLAGAKLKNSSASSMSVHMKLSQSGPILLSIAGGMAGTPEDQAMMKVNFPAQLCVSGDKIVAKLTGTESFAGQKAEITLSHGANSVMAQGSLPMMGVDQFNETFTRQ
jgi:hypothetical protein